MLDFYRKAAIFVMRHDSQGPWHELVHQSWATPVLGISCEKPAGWAVLPDPHRCHQVNRQLLGHKPEFGKEKEMARK